LEIAGALPERATTTNAHLVHLPAARRLTLSALVCVIFFTVSGGAYGIESLPGKVGAGLTVVFILATPLLWSLPIALMVSELSSMMPEEGGYYVWVRRALGDFWGVQEGWWTIGYTCVDMAIYPVLFVNYLAFFVPELAKPADGPLSWRVWFLRWLVCVAIIVVSCAINWRGAKAVGRQAQSVFGFVLAAFVVLAIIGLTKDGALGNAWTAIATSFTARPDAALLAVGISTVLWNYSGWDNVSTYAGEVNEAEKSYPRAMALALPLTVGAYLLPTLAGLGTSSAPEHWTDGSWPVIGEMIAGRWLGLALAGAALLSAWSLFNSQLLYVSRLPYRMACDGWLPKFFARANTETGVPRNALLFACGAAALFSMMSFDKLVIMDIMLYCAELSLEFVALAVLRWRQPDAPRPFRVPLGWLGVVYVCLAPTAFGAFALWANLQDQEQWRQLVIVAAILVSGPFVYYLQRHKTEARA
jgi:amino acid transporter